MSAFRQIEKARKLEERIDFVGAVSLAMHGTKEAIQKAMTGWAREADTPIRFDD